MIRAILEQLEAFETHAPVAAPVNTRNIKRTSIVLFALATVLSGKPATIVLLII